MRRAIVNGGLTMDEKSQILQTVWVLTSAASSANFLESSMCQGYNMNTWNMNAHKPIKSDTLGIQVLSLDALLDGS